jgi:hypothetical protein
MKQTVTLHFPSLDDLYKFSKEVGPNNFEISIRALLLSCDCTDEHIKLAVTKYGATVIQQESGSQNVSEKCEKE